MMPANDGHCLNGRVARALVRVSLGIAGAFFGGLFLVRAAGAQDGAKTKEAIDNLQAELSVCIAFFSIFQECSPGNEKHPSSAELANEELERRSRAAADAVGLSSADVAMRLRLNLTRERHLIGSCSGTSVLSSRYSQQCNDLVQGADGSSGKDPVK
jgi:hypothetical protein